MTDPYRRTQAAVAREVSTRSVERDVLLRVTRALEAAKESGNRIDLVRAATQNQTLWMVFITDVMNESNQLPKELRRQIAAVGMAAVREMTDNLNGNLDVDFLIDVNRAIIDGLSGGTQDAAPATSTTR
ncbi:MAG TPA: flagellar biosynthesis regulator FlaF [Azospirillaceae bacterium]|nr:flagellar biosynthesis regulator FlaF [Azospirillaceae bacterium]